MWTRDYWKGVAERAISTAAQGAITVIGAGAIVPAWEVPWQAVAGVAGTMAALSVLKSLAAAYIGDRGTPSLVRGGE